MQKIHVFVKPYAPGGNKVKKAICLLYFYNKGQSQGHKVIDPWYHFKGIISGVCMPNMKTLSFMVQKL